MSEEAEHASSVAGLRDELGALRLHGGISNQFVDWHGRLAACAEAITKELPSCADLCAELMSIDFEIPPEFAANMTKELSDDHRIITAGSETFFRSRCDQADEILNTLLIALRQAKRK
jgi:hypothetical protein